MMNKKRIVWMCHFSNVEIANLIDVKQIPTIAPWITDLINLFESKNDVELYIVAPNYYNNKNIKFQTKGVNYVLYKYTLLNLGVVYNQLTMLLDNYCCQKKHVTNALKSIQPDLIHLFGSENTSYSVAFNKVKTQYNSLITIQGFITLASPSKNFIKSLIYRQRAKYEKMINSYCKYYANGTTNAKTVLTSHFNSNVSLYDFQLPTHDEINVDLSTISKEYNLVFFSRVTKTKGIEDLLNAVCILKEKMNTISLVVVGIASESYYSFLIKKCHLLGITENVVFAGFQKTQLDAYKIVASADVFVLPTHFDGMPGCIRETMKLGVPIIANSVGAIPELNKDQECVKLVEKGNINQLADSILEVLNNNELQNMLICNAADLIDTKFSNQKIYDNLLGIYGKLIKKK